MGSSGGASQTGGPRRRPLPSQQRPDGAFTAVDFTIGGAGIALVAVGQYVWSMGRRGLGIALVAVGGVLVAAVLVRAALKGLVKPRK